MRSCSRSNYCHHFNPYELILYIPYKYMNKIVKKRFKIKLKLVLKYSLWAK
jgi:hypothetical protein